MAPKRRSAAAADQVATSSSHAVAGPSTRVEPQPSPKRIKVEPSESESAGDAEPTNQISHQTNTPPLMPPLMLNGINPPPARDDGRFVVTEVLLLAPNMSFLRAGTDALFSINCTPRECPKIPTRVATAIYNSIYKDPLPEEQRPRYIHIGRTNALGFPLHFYTMLKTTPQKWREYDHLARLPRKEYAEWFDNVILPALRASSSASKYGLEWSTYGEYYDAWRSISRKGPLEQNLPVTAVHGLWAKIVHFDQGEHLGSATLFAYGDPHTAGTDAKWPDFSTVWERHVDPNKLTKGSRITTSIDLSVGV